MSFNGSGTFTPYTPGNPVVTGTTISSTAFNNTITDLANGLTNAVTRDGQSPATSNIPMGNNRITGLAAAVSAGDALSMGNVATVSAGTVSLPSLTTTGDTNTGVYFPAADTVGVTTGGTERVRIDSAGNLGLSVTPSAWNTNMTALQFGARQASLVSGSLWSSAPNVQLQTNAYWTAGGQDTYIATAVATRYVQSNGAHSWHVAPSGTAGTAITFTQVLAVEKDKTLALQGATSVTGAGISFPATQVASSDANTLDDYEEGTFTPTVQGGTTAGVGTYTTQVGRYQKVGNHITVSISLVWTAHTGTGALQVAGLPFASAALASNVTWPAATRFQNLTFTNPTVCAGLSVNSSVMFVNEVASNAATTNVPIDTAASLWISVTYEV